MRLTNISFGICISVMVIVFAIVIVTSVIPTSTAQIQITPVSIAGYRVLDSCFNVYDTDTKDTILKMDYCKSNNLVCSATVSTYALRLIPELSNVKLAQNLPASCVKV